MGYFVLVVLYGFLLVFYAWNQQGRPVVQGWDVVNAVVSDAEEVVLPATCATSKDCPKGYVCLGHKCVPKLLRGEKCLQQTGKWTLFVHYGRAMAKCTCLDDRLTTQMHFGGNCTEEVACRPHGHYNYATATCECSPGYIASGLTCRRMTAFEREPHFPCEADEIELADVKREHGFSDAYLHNNAARKCFKRPCTFDAYSGRPLKRARYEEGVGCVCDPTLGQYGVRLKLDYVRGPGYNACASIFSDPIDQPIPVDIYAYFYLMQRPPVVFLSYENLDDSKLTPPLRDLLSATKVLQLSQEFPFDYMQTFLGGLEPWKRLDTVPLPSCRNNAQQNEILSKQSRSRMEYCRYMTRQKHMSRVIKFRYKYRVWDYNLLYNFPACYVGLTDPNTPDLYKGRYVLNPLQLTWEQHDEDVRFNGLLLGFDGQSWHLDFAPPYDVDTYIAAAVASKDNIPVLHDEVLEALQNSRLPTADNFKNVEDHFKLTQHLRTSRKEPQFDP